MYVFTYLSNLFIYQLIDLFTCLLIILLIYQLIHSFINLFIYQPIHSFTSDDVTYVYDDVTDDY